MILKYVVQTKLFEQFFFMIIYFQDIKIFNYPNLVNYISNSTPADLFLFDEIEK